MATITMTPAQAKAVGLLRAFGAASGASLALNEGVCVLHGADGAQAAVVEVPAASDSVLLHCRITSLRGREDSRILRLMLLLNFEMAAMKGCWLALDEQETLRLCTQYALDPLDETQFNALLAAFIEQVRETRLLIEELSGAGAAV